MFEDEQFVRNFLKEKSRKKNCSSFGRKGQHIKIKDIVREKNGVDISFRAFSESSLKYQCHVNSSYLKKLASKSRRRYFKQELSNKFYKGDLEDLVVNPSKYGRVGCGTWWN